MAVSESKKKANLKWDSAYMATLACKVKKEQAEQFKAYCSGIGETVNSVFQRYVSDCISGNLCKDTQDAAGAHGGASGILMPETLKTAQEAAQSAGETVSVFVGRAVATQAQRDKMTQSMKKAPVKTDA